MKKTNAIIILDGFGLSENTDFNAIKQAKTPYLDHLFATFPHCKLSASGADVGLPQGQMGNSEVGHLNLGAGRIVYQDISAISNSIANGTFFENDVLKGAFKNAKDKTLHLCGLASNGGVHSDLGHLFALLRMAKAEGVSRVLVHCITDGRDTPPTSAHDYVKQIESECANIGVGKIASVLGRFFAMDRDNRWERVKEGYNCIFDGMGKHFESAANAVESCYKNGITDEFIPPCIIGDYNGFNKNDSLIFFNFRADRAREFSKAASEPSFDLFDRAGGFKNPYCVGLTLYDNKLVNVRTAFEPKSIKNTLGNWLSAQGLSQARVAETEKYAHVTFFFNGGIEQPDKLEARYLIPSPKVKTYDLAPCMSANEVAKTAASLAGEVDVLVVNFANCDMVGHTGDFNAAVAATECVDKNLKTVVEAVLASNGAALILSDHGNAEIMAYADGSPLTAHTTSPVPLILVSQSLKTAALKDGRLCDVAPTFLSIIGLSTPTQMTGECLLKS